MRRIASQTGQGAAEYLGGLLVVSVIIALLATTDAGATIRTQVTRVVCEIAQRDDCVTVPEPGDPTDPADPADPDGPDSGPAFGDGPYPVPGLPWDGSVTVSGNSNEEDGLYLEASVTRSTSECRLDSEGKPMVDLNVTGTLKAGAKVSEGEETSVSIDAYLGKDLGYTISTDPEHADDIQHGDGPVPSPVDPRTIPEGTSITLDEKTYSGLDMEGSYHGIQASLGYEQGTKVSSSVERVDGDTVRVTVGDADLVKSSLGLALGTDAANVSVGSDRELATGKTRQVDIDISTKAGQKAYGEFLKSGNIPDSGAGVHDPRSSQVVDFDGSTHLGGHLGPIDATIIDRDAKGQIVETTNPDGTISVTQFAREDGVGITRQATIDADGNEGPATYALRLQDVDDNVVAQMQISRGEDPTDGNQDVTIDLTDADLDAMHEAAIDQVYYRAHQMDDGWTREMVEQALEDRDPSVAFPGSPVTTLIGMADSPVEVAQALARMAYGDPNRLGLYLSDFDRGTLEAHHGLDGLRHPERYTDELVTPDPVLTEPAC